MNPEIADDRPSVVLVCTGWREMHNLPYGKTAVAEWFDYIERNYGRISRVIEGGARGADTLCRDEAMRRGLPFDTVKAEWDRYGKRAGMLRNREMIELAERIHGEDRIVGLAFLAPASKGTRDMMRQMEEAGWWYETVNLPNTEQVA